MGSTRTCSSCGGEVADALDRCPKDGAAAYSAEVLSRIGLRLKDHEIQSVIGEGGMGAVYRAQHVVIEKPVAIKVLHDSFARQNDMVEQFIVEAKAASRIRHPNTIDVTDFGITDEGLVFLVMEYLEGESLEARLARVGRLAPFDAINIVKQVARGLGAAHGLGVIHRDLKPANIFLCRRVGRRRIVRRTTDGTGAHFTIEPESSYDFVKLLDFGVAKFLDLGPGAVTRAGALCGSPHYLSPEQAQERPATQRSDLYALGITLYEMVTGTVPFAGTSMLEILNGHVAGVVAPPSQRAPDAGIDADLDAVIMQCLRKDPEERFASIEAVGEALRACVTDRAFLRDAYRLPGIRESGLDLSEASGEAHRASIAETHEQGFSATEESGASAVEPGERPGRPARQRAAGNTLRIPRERTGPWVLAVVLVVGAAAVALAWRRDDGTAARAPVATSPTPATSAAPTSPAVAAPAIAAPTPSPAPLPVPDPSPEATTPASPSAGLGLGKRPERPAEKSPTRSRAAAPLGPIRLPPLPPVTKATPPAPVAPPSTTGPSPSPSAALPSLPAPSSPAPAETKADLEALLRDAQQAWSRRYYAVAIDKAREVLKVDPRRQAAHQIIAVCSCATGAAADAQEAVTHLDDHKRKLVQSLCQRHGIALD